MREHQLTVADLLAVLADPVVTGQDGKGNPVIEGWVRGERIRIVIARDDSSRVITLFERR